jgi:tRNA pseudouridine13 synthase
MTPPTSALALPPLITAALPGIGGTIKTQPEDFEVEEVPAYEPCGQGEFLYLWVEKRAMGAEYFVRQVARRLGVGVNEVGTAGLKDRHAVTRQMVSVPQRAEERLRELEGDGIRLLGVGRHGNKLRAGHLHGNRFRILVRGVDPHAAGRVAPILEQLRRDGMANFYGPQRFGHNFETAQLGLDMLRGNVSRVRTPFLRRLALSAAQSVLFNHYLARRIADGLFRRVLAGDVMAKWPYGGMFVAENLAREQARLEGREIVPTGPMFGRKMFRSAAEAAHREQQVLEEANVSPQAFLSLGKLSPGTRRHTIVYLDDLTAAEEPEGVRLTFTLPAGSYATVLLREIIKTDNLDAEDG